MARAGRPSLSRGARRAGGGRSERDELGAADDGIWRCLIVAILIAAAISDSLGTGVHGRSSRSLARRRTSAAEGSPRAEPITRRSDGDAAGLEGRTLEGTPRREGAEPPALHMRAAWFELALATVAPLCRDERGSGVGGGSRGYLTRAAGARLGVPGMSRLVGGERARRGCLPPLTYLTDEEPSDHSRALSPNGSARPQQPA
jgi:hypothetical protein